MKRAVILHGTDGNPDINWLSWVKNELIQRGYEVYAPLLPENHTPNKDTYSQFLRQSGWDFTDNLLVGHSSGATTVLNLLSSDWFPNIETAVLVGVFLNEDLLPDVSWYEPGQFDKLFPKLGFDAQQIRSKVDKIYCIHGDNDPYCSYDDARIFTEAVGGKLITVEQGLHLSSNRKELSELLPILDEL